MYVRNYTSISISGSGRLTFNNKHPHGSVVILKSQGNVILTSSATPMIDLRQIGADPSMDGSGLITGPSAPRSYVVLGSWIVSGGQSVPLSQGGRGVLNSATIAGKAIPVFAGAGGGNGISSGSSGIGGQGGGGLYVECGGALNFTGQVDVSGQAGTNGTGTGPNTLVIAGSGGGSQTDGSTGPTSISNAAYGGGGGGAGSCCIVYASLSANTGTVITTGGTGGLGGPGGVGGQGWTAVLPNTEF